HLAHRSGVRLAKATRCGPPAIAASEPAQHRLVQGQSVVRGRRVAGFAEARAPGIASRGGKRAETFFETLTPLRATSATRTTIATPRRRAAVPRPAARATHTGRPARRPAS